MNKERRKELQKALDLIEEAKQIIEACKEEEEEAFENLPEGLQQAFRGQRIEENISYLDDAFSSGDEMEQNIQAAIAEE